MKKNTIDFTRLTNDVNGNPRYVCHFLNLLTKKDLHNYDLSINGQYLIALGNSRQFGGKKYNNKTYGGGIVFQSYNIEGLTKDIISFTEAV